MLTSFIKIENINIAYYEINEAAGKTIFFVHGNSVSKNCWRKQLESGELKNYRLIAFDLPGHGESGKAANAVETYTLKGFAAIAVKIVQALKKDKPYIMVGLSLGANILTEMLAYNLQPAGIALAGPSVAGKNFLVSDFVLPGTKVNVVFTEDADEKDVLKYANETSISSNEHDIKAFIHDYEQTDKKVRSGLAACISKEDYSDEVDLLKQSNILFFIVFGKDEKIVNPDYLDNAELPLWKNTIFKIHGASHLVNIDKPDEFNKLLSEYAEAVFK